MLFRNILDGFQCEVDEALDELFDMAKANQSHEQDLLLLEINGFYNASLDEARIKNRMNLSPFVFGPGGWVYFTDLISKDYFRINYYGAFKHI